MFSQIFDITLPHLYFIDYKKALWYNIASWGAKQFKWCVKGDLDKILLPGPAKWWLEGYDINKARFLVPEYNKGYIIAFNLMILPKHLAAT